MKSNLIWAFLSLLSPADIVYLCKIGEKNHVTHVGSRSWDEMDERKTNVILGPHDAKSLGTSQHRQPCQHRIGYLRPRFRPGTKPCLKGDGSDQNLMPGEDLSGIGRSLDL